jgi:hypothetical protein
MLKLGKLPGVQLLGRPDCQPLESQPRNNGEKYTSHWDEYSLSHGARLGGYLPNSASWAAASWVGLRSSRLQK